MPRSRFSHAMKTASICWNTLRPNMVGVLKKIGLVYPDNVGIEDETIDCSHGDSEVADDQ